MQNDALPRRPGPSEPGLLQGLHAHARQLLLQLLMYKSVFMGDNFRDLAFQQPHEVRDVLIRLHGETIEEAQDLAMAMQVWDAHPAGGESLQTTVDESRRRFLADILTLKNGVVDVGLTAALRAPSEDLRRRFMALTDIDREHADAIRRLLHVPTVEDHLGASDHHVSGPVGAGVGRASGQTLARTLSEAIKDVREKGAAPTQLILSADGIRHARDEGIIDLQTGRAFGVPVHLDLGWRGDCWAIVTSERLRYAELITATSSSRLDR